MRLLMAAWYAGPPAICPAGVTVVVIRKDLMERCQDSLPGYLNYSLHAKNNSAFNTPPTFAVYMVGLVAKWLLEDIGGLEAMAKINRSKAQLLYETIDDSGDPGVTTPDKGDPHLDRPESCVLKVGIG